MGPRGSVADDRVLLVSLGSAAQHQRWHTLANVDWHRRHVSEAQSCNPFRGFAVGMAGWFFILFESFMGDADQVAAPCDEVNKHVKASFQTMFSRPCFPGFEDGVRDVPTNGKPR